jgi:hypothetical protein
LVRTHRKALAAHGNATEARAVEALADNEEAEVGGDRPEVAVIGVAPEGEAADTSDATDPVESEDRLAA